VKVDARGLGCVERECSSSVEAEAGGGVGTIAASGPWCRQWVVVASDNSQQVRSRVDVVWQSRVVYSRPGAGDVVNGSRAAATLHVTTGAVLVVALMAECGQAPSSSVELQRAWADWLGCVSYDLTWR